MKEKYENLSSYLREKYWLDYLSAIEKKTLQSFRDDIVKNYILSEEEKRALMFIGSISIDGQKLSLRRR